MSVHEFMPSATLVTAHGAVTVGLCVYYRLFGTAYCRPTMIPLRTSDYPGKADRYQRCFFSI